MSVAISSIAKNEITTSQAPRNDKTIRVLSLRANVNERGNLSLYNNEITTGINSEGILTRANVPPRNDKHDTSLRAEGVAIFSGASNEITTGVNPENGISTRQNVPPRNDITCNPTNLRHPEHIFTPEGSMD